MNDSVIAIRGPVLTYSGDAFCLNLSDCMHYESDALVVMEAGKISHVGPASQLLATLPPSLAIKNYGPDCLIMAGFIDCHVHYSQLPIIGSYGTQLLEWLNRHAFPTEMAFADADYAKSVADIFLTECLRVGTTTASVYCTVHPQSVNAFFTAASQRNMRMLAGKVIMDRNAPADLTDTTQSAYDDTKALIQRWHGKNRLSYAITPRFAPTSSFAQMEMIGALWQEHPGTYLQSHLAENQSETALVQELFPQSQHYLDVYDHYGQLGPRAIYGHGIWLSETELARCAETGTAIAHCPTSNLFLGSGLFDLASARNNERPVLVGLATDVGGGTSLSMLQTLNEAYKVAQMAGYSLPPELAFYLATRGGAQALYLEDTIGSIAPGMEADIVVLDMKSTPLIAFRMEHADSLAEQLFIQMTLGDDRAVLATYIAGKLAHHRN